MAAAITPGPGSRWAGPDLREAIHRELTRRGGVDADPQALALAASRAYAALAGQLAVLIGDGGVRALTSRSLYLVQRQFPWLADRREGDPALGPFERVRLILEHQEAAVAREAAVETMATLGGLLATLIGEPLTQGAFQAAWPGPVADETRLEAREP